MKFIGKILVTALAAIIAANLIPGVSINGGLTAIILALVLALLNTFVKPIFILLTIPVTIFTLGLFLLVINTLIIKWASLLVTGFTVLTWWSAFWFSILLSLVTYVIEALIGDRKERQS
jgi:putative membrane protein